jgi:hypothetical protein
MSIQNERLSVTARQPLPQIQDDHSKHFAAAKDAASRSKEDNVPDRAPQYRGPVERGATGGSASPGTDRQTGPDGGRHDVGKAKIDSGSDKAKNDHDSMSEMGEMESLRLQMAMDRLSKTMSALSNTMKQMSDTQRAITANLK